MSDAASIAASTGVPEDMVMRSARARAEANGTTVEDVLSAWGGGGSIAAPPAASELPTPVDTPAQSPAPTSLESAAIPAPTELASPLPVSPPALVGPPRDAAPLLVGRSDKPMAALAVLVVLFIVGAVLAVGVAGLDAQNTALDQIPGTTPVLSDRPRLAETSICRRAACTATRSRSAQS